MIFAPSLAINTAPTEEHLLPGLRRINLRVRLTNVSLSRKYRMRLWAGNRNFCKWEFHRRFNSLLILEGGQVDCVLPARPNRGPCQGFSWPYLFLNSKEDGKTFLQLDLVYWGDFPGHPQAHSPPHSCHQWAFFWPRSLGRKWWLGKGGHRPSCPMLCLLDNTPAGGPRNRLNFF